MRIATSLSLVTPDVRLNGRRARSVMGAAATAKARVVHFTEGALSGYAKSEITSWRDVEWPVVEEELAATAEAAARLGVWVVIGCNHRLAEPSLPQNCLYVISDRGVIR